MAIMRRRAAWWRYEPRRGRRYRAPTNRAVRSGSHPRPVRQRLRGAPTGNPGSATGLSRAHTVHTAPRRSTSDRRSPEYDLVACSDMREEAWHVAAPRRLQDLMRYIGSKARVAHLIAAHIGEPSQGGSFVDAFCGTGAIAEAALDLGWSIRLNDHLVSATNIAFARLVAGHQVPFTALGGYPNAISLLNHTEGTDGFIWSEYSPASTGRIGFERRYFTPANAAKIDGLRRTIAAWVTKRLISRAEEDLLLGDLLEAASRVANTAGTYGCFLYEWSPPALRPLTLEPRVLKNHDHEVDVVVGDVTDTPHAEQDTVYLDPPYTKRQYAAYYHIQETIAIGDAPKVEGITGLRPWQDKASAYCYRRRARRSLGDLVSQLSARRVLLSYSSQGHVVLEELVADLRSRGETVIIHPLGEIGRYRPNVRASLRSTVVDEYLLEIRRPAELLRAAG